MSQSRELPEPFVRHGDQLDQFLQNFWQRQVDAAENEPPPYGRHPPLPLARIKKVMKSDPDVRMIASDAPVLFCKACEIFIQEITCRAFLVADAHKRRTISKQDIAKALAKSDHFDFLIDVVPRDEHERAKTQKLINSSLEEAEAAEQVAAAVASGSQLANPPQYPPHIMAELLKQQAHAAKYQTKLRAPPVYPPPPSHQQTPQMGMSHNMLGQQAHPQQHQQRPHSSMMQHERNDSGTSSGGGVHPPPPSLTMAPGGGTGHGHGRPHSLSASQSQPPPLIPNASLRSPTGGTHPPHSFGHGHPQPHSSQGQQQQHQQHQHQHQHQHQQQNGGNRRSSVSSRMSLSPTIPLSTSRMEPPSSLDLGR